jgi:hypothetical protein
MRWVVVAVIFVVVFGVFSTVYAAAAKRTEVRVLPKWLWVLMCAFIPIVGGLLYLTLGRPLGPAGPTRLGPQTKVVAPDDDPNFLRDLKRKLNQDKPGDSAGKPEDSPEETPTDETDDGTPEVGDSGKN